MNVLVACEESQAVCTEFRKLGHNAFSCDIAPCSGGHTEWHICKDVTQLLNGNISFVTCDGVLHYIDTWWDLIIAHPPCTYLSCAGNGYFNEEKYGDAARLRKEKREEAVKFFMMFVNAPCDHICIENPCGYMNGHYRKPDQVIHPYYFASSETDSVNFHMKRTCLWLKGLKPLEYEKPLTKPQPIYIDKVSGKKRYYVDAIAGTSKNGAKNRSKTFPGIARAMAEQWSKYLQNIPSS